MHVKRFLKDIQSFPAQVDYFLLEIARLDNQIKELTGIECFDNNDLNDLSLLLQTKDSEDAYSETYNQLLESIEESYELASRKHTLATKTYNLIDRQIRKIDTEIAKDRDIVSRHGRKKRRNDSDGEDTENDMDMIISMDINMPVDPNEPTYCLCHQISYGEMIACDNSECTIEWFHFLCVGLTRKPKGGWLCPKCTNQFNNSHKQ